MNVERWQKRVAAIVQVTRLVCPGCGLGFDPVRPGQVHCRKGCIRLEAERRREVGNLFDDGDDDGAAA
jgi:hypothetical protein